MDDYATTMHKADNPLNLANLLNTGLRIAEARLAPAVVPSANQQVLATPGERITPTPTKIDDPAAKGWSRYLPHVLIGGAVLAVLGLVVWAVKGK